MNQGHLAGVLMRRTTGKGLKKFVADEMVRPLGADFQIGAVEKDWPHVSSLIPSPPRPVDAFAGLYAHSPAIKKFNRPASGAFFALTPVWRRG